MTRGLIRRLAPAALFVPAVLMAGCESEPTGLRIVALVAVSGLGQTGFPGALLSQPFVVRAEDQGGRPVEGAIVVWTVESGGGTVAPSQSVTGADGLASATLRLGSSPGQQSVSATIGNARPVLFTATTPIVGSPASAVAVAGNNQAAPPGSRLADSLVVRVTDQSGNPVSGVTVVWSVAVGSGSVSPATSVTDAAGRAATSWTIGATGGPMSVQALPGSLAPISFTAASTIIFASVQAGAMHSCGLDEGGVAFCWGYNGDGQLGVGAVAGGSGPVFSTTRPAAVGGGQTFSRISSGGFHTCGPTLSINPYCWGKNVDGRLGDGSNSPTSSPVHVSGPNVFSALTAGGTHTCGLTPGGRVFCWGSNLEGQLGVVILQDPDSTGVRPPPVVPEFLLAPLRSDTVSRTWRAVAAGGLHTCALTTSGQAYCWGAGGNGQLGNGNSGSVLPEPVTSLDTYVAIAAGDKHTCALTASGSAWCWGVNSDGQLGDNTVTDRDFPTQVAGGITFASISAGIAHTCGLSTSGVAYCWGRNASGQLGNGATAAQSMPVAVGGGFTWTGVSAGERHSCGVTTGRVAYCWGGNQFGQVGDGTQVNRTLPAKVAFQP